MTGSRFDTSQIEYDTEIIETKRNNKCSSPITMYGHREWNKHTYAENIVSTENFDSFEYLLITLKRGKGLIFEW